MKKTIKKSSNIGFYIFIAGVIFTGMLPFFAFLYWMGTSYFYATYTPPTCKELLKQTNLLQPPIQIGTNWDDSSALYFVPVETYVGQGGYGFFAKEVNTSICEQSLKVDGVLQYRQGGDATIISPTKISLEIVLREKIGENISYQFTNVLSETLSRFTPTQDKTTNTRIMQFSEVSPGEPISAYGYGYVSQFNGKSVELDTFSISQHEGVWTINTRNL